MEEKFISIEYSTWLNKYLPLEKENEKLKEELDSKTVKLRLINSQYYLGGGEFITDFTVDLQDGIKETEELKKIIKQQVENILYKDSFKGSINQRIITQSDLNRIQSNSIKCIENIEKLPNWIKKLYNIEL